MFEEMVEEGAACCASCGIAEIDDVKLVPCDACDLVQYCSDECQQIHKSEHEEDCTKRAAELRDELLFKLPESSHLGDCPICMIPLSLDPKKSNMNSCCSKIFCIGCVLADSIREEEQSLAPSCPFCREPAIRTDEEWDKLRMKRVEMNDPVALSQKGIGHYQKGDYIRAFESLTKSAELGAAQAHYHLALLYQNGHGVEKDEGKEIHHLEEAAIGGHPGARHNLGCVEAENFKVERAVKHWMIAAKQGEDVAVKTLMGFFKLRFVSKDDLAAALRAHKAAVDATKSPQREAAEEFYRENNLR